MIGFFRLDLSVILNDICTFSDYSGPENVASFYGEFSVCSEGPANLNQYEKIGTRVIHRSIGKTCSFLGSSIHNVTKAV